MEYNYLNKIEMIYVISIPLADMDSHLSCVITEKGTGGQPNKKESGKFFTFIT